MANCVNHPDRPAAVPCQKVPFRGYCSECLEDAAPCFDPELYCKFRSACIIWELARENGRHRRQEAV
ncbi:MAG: hypothetical protein JRC92_09700 [Deltaproteobacteria bacterium]|nr:hypothetical protein [Deltaproteobacteria bacterium]